MRRILGIFVLALAIGSSVPASAQYRSQHNYYRGGGNGWVAPLVGGLVVGGMVGALASQPRYYAPAPVIVEEPRYYCRNVVVGRDYYTGRPIIERVCD